MSSARAARRGPDTVFIRGFGLAEGIEWGFWLAAVVFWVVELELSPLRLVLLSLAIELAVIVSETPTGVVADLRSRRLSILIGETTIGLSFLAMVATTNYAVVIASMVVFGVGWTFRSGSDAAWLSDELAGDRATTGEAAGDAVIERVLLAKQRFGLAVAIPTLLVTMLVGAFTTVRFAGAVMGAMHLGIALYFARAMTEEHFTPGRERGAGFRQTLRTAAVIIGRGPSLRVLVVVVFVVFFAAEAFDTLGFKHFLDVFDPQGAIPEDSIVVLGALFLVLAVGGYIANRITDHQLAKGTRLVKAVVICCVAASIGGFVVAFGNVALVIAVGYVMHESVRTALIPLFEAWVNRDAPSEVRATVHSLTGQVMSLGQLSGGLLLGTVAEIGAIPTSLAVASGVLLIAGAVASRGVQRHA